MHGTYDTRPVDFEETHCNKPPCTSQKNKWEQTTVTESAKERKRKRESEREKMLLSVS